MNEKIYVWEKIVAEILGKNAEWRNGDKILTGNSGENIFNLKGNEKWRLWGGGKKDEVKMTISSHSILHIWLEFEK